LKRYRASGGPLVGNLREVASGGAGRHLDFDQVRTRVLVAARRSAEPSILGPLLVHVRTFLLGVSATQPRSQLDQVCRIRVVYEPEFVDGVATRSALGSMRSSAANSRTITPQ
jgi:hypothetical protein